jgi:tetratricopeptide (TPR) repeat protein
MAREHHLAREMGEACSLLAVTALAQGRWRERFRSDFEEAIRLAPSEANSMFDAHLCLAETGIDGADSGALAVQARELLSAAERAGSLRGRAVASLLVGESELLSGRAAESRQWLTDAAELFGQAAAPSGRAFAIVRLAESAIALGKWSEAARLLTEARDLAERSELAPHLVVRVFAASLAAAARPDRQRVVLEEAERRLRPAEVCGPCSIRFRVAAAIAYARAGELVKAHRCLADAESLVGMWQGGPWRAATWEARAFVRGAEGDRVQASALFREAATLFADAGRAIDERRCREEADDLPRLTTSD